MSDVLECAICLDEIKDNQRALPCAHVFHAACIAEWTNKSKSCPICRQRVVDNFIEEKARSSLSYIAKNRLRRLAKRHCRHPKILGARWGYKRKRHFHISK